MNRRDALVRVAALMGSSLSAPTLFAIMEGCNSSASREAVARTFTPETMTLLGEVAETIIPKTTTPGAKEAGVADFVKYMITDCYEPKNQQSFFSGLDNLEEKSQKAHQQSFVKLTPAQRTEVFKEIEKEAFDIREKRQKNDEAKKKKATDQSTNQNLNGKSNKDEPTEEEFQLDDFYFIMKDLTILGYFTSEPGATQALDYVPIPGRYDGCIELKPGQKAYAI